MLVIKYNLITSRNTQLTPGCLLELNLGVTHIMKNVKSLVELAEFINNATDDESDSIDYSSLPTFGGIDINDTAEVWSWDEKSILVQNSIFEIEPRCSICGEARFHCHHNQ